MIQAQPLRIHVFKEPEVISFETEGGGVVCAAHLGTGIGGGVLITETAYPKVRMLVWGLVQEIQRLSGCTAVEIELKIAGPKIILDSVHKIAKELNLGIKGEAIEQGKLAAYFYTQNGRLRVAPVSSGAEAKVSKRKKVLIVDDSGAIRKVLEYIFTQDPDFEVVGSVGDPQKAEEMIEQTRPDVVTLDIHMPGMNGVQLLERILKKRAIPAVMITSLSMDESDLVLRALELGAVDYIQKPSFEEIETKGPLIAERVKHAAAVRVRASSRPAPSRISAVSDMDTAKLIAIGASTGGTEAIRMILTQLPEKIPPIAIVQHIPPVFSSAFARRLNELCPFEVKEAEDGDLLTPNRVLIAPGGLQMRITGSHAPYRIRITDEPAINRHKPSVDALFDSVAENAKANAIGVILTGMGGDGAKGLLKMRQAGAKTIAQSEASCIVFGMPREAINIGAAEQVCELDGIAGRLVDHLRRDRKVA